MTQITVFEGLTQLKLLKKRIEELTNQLVIVSVVQGEQVPPGFGSVRDFVNKSGRDLQSVQDLITRRSRIKSALVKSNATTEIKVNGGVMTVAEAIELKNSIDFKVNLLDKIKKMWYNSKALAERNNQNVQQQANASVANLVGDNKDTPDQASVDALMEMFLKRNLWKVVAPNSIESTIEELEAEINGFLSEVDARLNESNATTLIEVQD